MGAADTIITYTKSSTVKDFIELLKPRVMSLVVFTGFIGLYIAPGNIHPLIAFIAILCIAIASGGSSAFNMWYDCDIDAIMPRTQTRPIPSHRIHPDEVLYFSMFLLFLSVIIMWTFVNPLSSCILLLAIIFYVGIYTVWLKRISTANIVIGGAAGAFPPVIGWTSVTNSLSLEPLILFLIIFLWTPPHFWALSILRKSDYEKASVPMMPVIYGDYKTQVQMFFYTIALSLVTVIPYALNFSKLLYLVMVLALNVVFLYLTYPFRKAPMNNMRIFKYSIFYLFSLFCMILIDKI